MPSSILARADALMLRHQQGSTSALDDLPVLTDAVDIDDNIPTLEQETQHLATAVPQALTPECHETDAQPLPAELLKQLADRIEQRLIAQIPTLIQDTLQEILSEQKSHQG